MDRLIDMARKMEEEQATPASLARVIVSSYGKMDRQREELRTGQIDRRVGSREPPIALGANRTVVSQQQRNSAEKKKLSRTDNVDPPKRQSLTSQVPQQKPTRPISSRQPQQPSEQTSKKVAVSFGE